MPTSILFALFYCLLFSKLAFSQVPEGLILLDSEVSPHAIIVDKKNRQLSLWKAENGSLKKVSEYPTDMGKVDGNKSKLGDHRTPEGIYFFNERLEQIPFDLYGSLAFATNYPNYFDEVDGKTGHGIWLHAIPDQVPLTRGSKGCVVVRDKVIHDLEKYIKLFSTPMIVQSSANLVSEQEIDKQKKQILDWVENWRAQWQGRNLDKYISFYSPQFKSLGMNLHQWKKYKQTLNEKYQFIKVELSHFQIFRHNLDWVVSFQQRYTSDKLTDLGIKTLYMRSENTSPEPKIIGEEWLQQLSQ